MRSDLRIVKKEAGDPHASRDSGATKPPPTTDGLPTAWPLKDEDLTPTTRRARSCGPAARLGDPIPDSHDARVPDDGPCLENRLPAGTTPPGMNRRQWTSDHLTRKTA